MPQYREPSRIAECCRESKLSYQRLQRLDHLSPNVMDDALWLGTIRHGRGGEDQASAGHSDNQKR